MADVRRLPTPDDRAGTFRAMARSRWLYAVERKLAGDEDGYHAALEDVRGLDEQAAEATLRAARVEIQQAKFDEEQRLRRKARSDEEDRKLQAGLCRLLDAMDGRPRSGKGR